MNINYETLTITENETTMTVSINTATAALFTIPTVIVDVFGNGRIGKKVPAEIVHAILDRVAKEIFPKFVEWSNDNSNSKLYNEITHVYMGY